jgi:hypothetical protein
VREDLKMLPCPLARQCVSSRHRHRDEALRPRAQRLVGRARGLIDQIVPAARDRVGPDAASPSARAAPFVDEKIRSPA